ncbi:glycosyltransferase family 39 protein [Pseudobacteriovorax antillogorgiicola]|uniref:4-amino-4-deoxy-L-arabinose transferase n=1 Tax=Pseudobacteriovorax antillogorgiicola TaxID=1513793 RepID=A0A1Y6CMW4_9BACT|nr:glycosyltransferase family 39 protein [Pseudobacteriovorax antillogorgiicola]TCS46924.1 4-amino-4-deoxy-L-arabinose transferase-like glycosyltransferase [Pseudobacteriovorax antillogorgiicola]SMF64249.1 4-amino-4-deoxy-L-arabinose transferase [Pseudobacteriovorax antillogorgiicola]
MAENSDPRDGGRSVLSWLFGALALGMVAYFGAQGALQMMSLDGWGERPAAWDQAVHALDAIHFAKAFQELDIHQFFLQIHNSALWPPVVPLLQSMYLLFTDLSIASARSSVALFSILAVIMIFFAGLRLDRKWGIGIGLLSAGALMVSPAFLDYSIQVMLEVPGIALTLLTFILYSRYLDREDPKYWNQAVISATVLFFAKFNYAIMIFLPMLACEFFRKASFRKPIADAVFYLVDHIRWKHPFSIFVYCYTAFLTYVHFVGIRFELAGHIVMIEKVFGNPLYFLILTIIIRMLMFQRNELKHYWSKLWNAPDQLRPVFRYFILPAILWMSYPPFFSTFFIFLFSESTRKQSFFSSETLTFYPSSFINFYSATPLLGYLMVAGVLLTLFSWRKLPVKIKFLLGIVIFNLILVLSHPNYQERYLLTVAPFLFLTGAFGLSLLFHPLLKFWSTGAPWVARIAGFASFAILVLQVGVNRDYLQKRFYFYTIEPSFKQFAEQICHHTYKAETNAIVGLSSFLNPAAIAMTCYDVHSDTKRRQLPTTMTRNGFHGYQDGGRVVASGKIGQYFVADYTNMKFDVGRKQEAYLLPGARQALPQSNLYQYIETIEHQDSGLTLAVYRRAPEGSDKPISKDVGQEEKRL